jgi:hypothetical protein
MFTWTKPLALLEAALLRLPLLQPPLPHLQPPHNRLQRRHPTNPR